MCFCKGIEAGMRDIAVLRLYLLNSVLLVCEAWKPMGNVFACARHGIWTNQYRAFYRGSVREEELIGLRLQNIDFKIRPVITCLQNIFFHKAPVDLTEMSLKKCEVFFVFSHKMYLSVKLCNKHVLSLFSRLDLWHHTKIRFFFLHSWIAIHGGNNIFTYTTLYSKETAKRKVYRRSTSIEQIPEVFLQIFFVFMFLLCDSIKMFFL